MDCIITANCIKDSMLQYFFEFILFVYFNYFEKLLGLSEDEIFYYYET